MTLVLRSKRRIASQTSWEEWLGFCLFVLGVDWGGSASKGDWKEAVRELNHME